MGGPNQEKGSKSGSRVEISIPRTSHRGPFRPKKELQKGAHSGFGDLVRRVCFRTRVQPRPSKTERMRVTVQIQVSHQVIDSTRLYQRRIDEHLCKVLSGAHVEWLVLHYPSLMCTSQAFWSSSQLAKSHAYMSINHKFSLISCHSKKKERLPHPNQRRHRKAAPPRRQHHPNCPGEGRQHHPEGVGNFLPLPFHLWCVLPLTALPSLF